MTYIAQPDRYSKMDVRRCGNSGVQLPLLSLGLWHNFGGVDDEQEYRKMVAYAFDNGIFHFDLANNYGPPPGSAESNFGKILSEELKGYRDELIISTKAGYLMWEGSYGEWGSKKYIVASLDQSLQRMGLDYVDIFYSHRYDPDTPLEETMGALAGIVQQGKALYVGISNYPPEETKQAVDILDNLGIPCLIHQQKYNMLHREPEEGLYDVLGSRKIGGIVYSPLAQGILSSKYIGGIPKDSRASRESGFLTSDELTEEIIDKVKKLNWLAQDRGQSLAQTALVWCLRDQRVTSVIIGPRNIKQLEDNIHSLSKLEFSDLELEEIERILEY